MAAPGEDDPARQRRVVSGRHAVEHVGGTDLQDGVAHCTLVEPPLVEEAPQDAADVAHRLTRMEVPPDRVAEIPLVHRTRRGRGWHGPSRRTSPIDGTRRPRLEPRGPVSRRAGGTDRSPSRTGRSSRVSTKPRARCCGRSRCRATRTSRRWTRCLGPTFVYRRPCRFAARPNEGRFSVLAQRSSRRGTSCGSGTTKPPRRCGPPCATPSRRP